MSNPIPIEIDSAINKETLASLKGESCHSDIVIPIEDCLAGYTDVKSYCPDGKNFSYVCWYVNNIIFAYATGMQKVSVRLSQTGTLDFNKLESPKSFNDCNSWYSVPYDSKILTLLVSSAYDSAKNS